MRQTHEYTSSQYNADNGFPLTWLFKRHLKKKIRSGIQGEAEENHRKHEAARSGKIIGRVAGPEAYIGKSANLRTKDQSSSKGLNEQKPVNEGK